MSILTQLDAQLEILRQRKNLRRSYLLTHLPDMVFSDYDAVDEEALTLAFRDELSLMDSAHFGAYTLGYLSS